MTQAPVLAPFRFNLLKPGVHVVSTYDLAAAEYLGPGTKTWRRSPLYHTAPSYRQWLMLQIKDQEPNPANLELKRLAWILKSKGKVWVGYDEHSKEIAETVGRALEWD